RSSASAEATVAGLKLTSRARWRTEGRDSPSLRAPLATPASMLRTSSAALLAWMRYCLSADTELYYDRYNEVVSNATVRGARSSSRAPRFRSSAPAAQA